MITPEQKQARDGLARGRPAMASSVVTVNGESFPAGNAVDGNQSTRWSSQFSDPQWIAVDLGKIVAVSRVELDWEAAYAKSYVVQVSQDGKTWTDAYKTDAGAGGREVVRFASREARWVRMYGTARETPYGYSLWEFRVMP